MTFLRLKDDGPHEIILKIHERPVEGAEQGLYTLAWTFDPVQLVPIVALAGKSKLIYVWRLEWDEDKGCAIASRLRVLKGHGGVRLPSISATESGRGADVPFNAFRHSHRI